MVLQTCSNCKEVIFVPRLDVDIAGTRERLRSETGPSSVQPAEIASILEDAQKDLDDYQSEVHRLQSRITFLNSQQDRLRSHMTQIRYLLAPIRRLPDELLRLIFYLCVWDHSDYNVVFFKAVSTCEDEHMRHNPAIAISNVSMRWRRIALSSPSVWSKFSLHCEWSSNADARTAEENDRRVLSLLNLYLLRSRQFPLALEISKDSYDDEPEDDRLLSALALLARHSARWRFLHVDADSAPDTKLSLHLMDIFKHNDFPLLEVLNVSFALPSHLEALIGKIPKLRHLEMLWGERAVAGFPWSQLSSLRCSPWEEESWEIYDACTGLVSLTVAGLPAPHDKGVPNRSYKTVEILILPADYKLDADEGGLPSALSRFTFPSLKTLQVDLSEEMFEPLRSLVIRSSCSITTLSLEYANIYDSQLISLLSLLPTVADLIVHTWGRCGAKQAITAKLMQSLCVGHLRAPFLPRLRSLSLSTGKKTFKDAAVVEMVKSQWLPDTRYGSKHEVDCLRSIEVHFPARVKVVGAYEELDHIERAGMRVAVRWKK